MERRLIDQSLPADTVVKMLALEPHPEGGWYRQTYQDTHQVPGVCSGFGSGFGSGPGGADRAASTAIYFLLKAGEFSHWHRIDAVEIWHYYAGGPLALSISANGHDVSSIRIGANLTAGERPQGIVPPGAWQAAESLGRWTLVGCTVAPGFTFDTFELAPPDWRPMPR